LPLWVTTGASDEQGRIARRRNKDYKQFLGIFLNPGFMKTIECWKSAEAKASRNRIISLLCESAQSRRKSYNGSQADSFF
jgi:hypothetical protein